MRWYNIVLNIFELAAGITGLLYWKKLKGSYWQCFPVYLLAIVITEAFGEYALYIKKDLDLNTAIYSYWGVPIQFFFFYWLFYQYFAQSKKNKWPLYAAVIYLLCWLSELFAWPDLFYLNRIKLQFDSFSYTIGNILLLVLLLMYFTRFIKSDELLNYRTSMMFWVSLGLMIFYVGSMPFYGIRTTLFYQYPGIFYPYWHIQYFLNYVMYLLFIIGLIWGKAK